MQEVRSQSFVTFIGNVTAAHFLLFTSTTGHIHHLGIIITRVGYKLDLTKRLDSRIVIVAHKAFHSHNDPDFAASGASFSNFNSVNHNFHHSDSRFVKFSVLLLVKLVELHACTSLDHLTGLLLRFGLSPIIQYFLVPRTDHYFIKRYLVVTIKLNLFNLLHLFSFYRCLHLIFEFPQLSLHF